MKQLEMSKKLKLIVILLLLSQVLLGQKKHETLGLAAKYASIPSDSIKLKQLSNLILPLVYLDIDTARYYANYLVKGSQALKYLPGQIEGLSHLGFIYRTQNEYTKAFDYALASLKLAKEYNRSVDYIVNQNNEIATIYGALEDNNKALEFYRQSELLIDSVRSLHTKYYMYFGMAKIYCNLEDFIRSDYCYNQARNVAKQLNNYSLEARVINQIGKNFYFQEKYDSALFYMEKAKSIRIKYKDTYWLITSERDLGMVYYKLHKLDMALQFLESSLHKSDSLGFPLSSLPTLQKMGLIFAKKDDCGNAILYLQKAYKIASEVGRTSTMIELLKKLVDSYTDCNQHLLIPRLFYQYDSLIQKTYDGKDLLTTEAKYQIEIIEKELESKNQTLLLMSQQERTEKNLKLALLAIMFLLSISLVLVYLRYRSIRKSRQAFEMKNSTIAFQKRRIEEMNEVLEKRLLRAQMNPHFVFNALNAIQHFIMISDKKSALSYLSKFSRLIRQTLENSLVSWVALSEELVLLKNYIELEQLRLNFSFTYHIELDESLDVNNIEIPFLIIQPYVENAINHGLKRLNKPGELLIRIEDQDGKIICLVEDNGIGRTAASKLSKNKIKEPRAMFLTEKRLELFNKDYQDAAAVTIVDKENMKKPTGTEVWISFAKKHRNPLMGGNEYN